MGGSDDGQARSLGCGDDAAATCAKAAELGGKVVADPRESPYGLMASLAGPAGEAFCINQAPDGEG
jgi:predicted enzyme related to lactoylglutathione lyase